MSLADIGKAPERVRFHPLKARHSLSLQRVKRDTAIIPVYGMLGIKTSSCQPAATTAQNETWLIKAKENITIALRCR